MPEWHTLRHAYGAAEDVPELLDQLSPDGEAAIWDELWSRVCHQGTVYTASFPVLPYLLAAASKSQPSQRPMPLALAATIVSSWDVKGSRGRLIAEHLAVVGELHQLTLETLASGAFTRNDYVYLLQAALAFQGDRLWGHELDRINEGGEFVGRCPHCDADVYIVLGEGRCFCTTEEWVNLQGTRREPISPCAPSQLPQVGRWLHGQCLAYGDGVLATSICHLFGSSICSDCGQSFQLPDAIGKVVQGC
jgi:hypothetical protein